MVFTLFHFLSVAWAQFKFESRVAPVALMLCATLADVEPLTGGLTGTYHWVLHSFSGAALLSLLVALVIAALQKRDLFVLSSYHKILHLRPRRTVSFKGILLSGLFGSLIHVLTDAFTHRNLPHVLFPFEVSQNPFWMGFDVGRLAQAVVVLLSVYSAFLWIQNASEQSLRR